MISGEVAVRIYPGTISVSLLYPWNPGLLSSRLYIDMSAWRGWHFFCCCCIGWCLPSGKPYSSFLLVSFPITMMMFHSHVSLPKGMTIHDHPWSSMIISEQNPPNKSPSIPESSWVGDVIPKPIITMEVSTGVCFATLQMAPIRTQLLLFEKGLDDPSSASYPSNYLYISK